MSEKKNINLRDGIIDGYDFNNKLYDKYDKLYEYMNIDNKYNVFFMNDQYILDVILIDNIIKFFRLNNNVIPHIISSIHSPHKLLDYLVSLRNIKEITLSLAECNIYGYTEYDIIKKYINKTTCLILIPYINYDTGAINNIPLIGDLIKTNHENILLMVNANYYSEQYNINAASSNTDIITFSFNNISICIIINKLINIWNKTFVLNVNNFIDFNIKSLLNNYKKLISNSTKKNTHLKNLRNKFIDILSKDILVDQIHKHISTDMTNKKGIKIILLSPNKNLFFPNIILLSIINVNGKFLSANAICNNLKKKGYIISFLERDAILLECISYPNNIKSCILKIYLCDKLTINDIEKFISVFKKVIIEQLQQ